VPTYQYTCTDCGDQVEAVQRFTDTPLSECSTCGGRLRKVFSPVGIVFKGSGFYRTDSRNGAGSSSALTKEKQSSDSGSATSSEPGANGNGRADKPAAKKPGETVSSPVKSASSSAGEKVA
jgi:putative FmdB family regulatory protein